MTTLMKREAPGLLAGAAGASDSKEGYGEHAPHAPTISRTAIVSNPPCHDPIVEAIRILARHGRRIREEEAQTANDQTVTTGVPGGEQ
jgi:hypothetical protein